VVVVVVVEEEEAAYHHQGHCHAFLASLEDSFFSSENHFEMN